MAMEPISYGEGVILRALTFAYPEREAPALRDISLEIRPGEFVVLCGPSGCGKTTLLRQLKPSLLPHGERSGEIFLDGAPLASLSQRDAAAKIGFVLQNPENQTVTDKVWHELAFGLESLGFDTPTIRLRVAEMASFFGIQTWFHQEVAALSGGQKQLLALASVMALQPSLLLLDEPTSQLDPIAAADFLAAVGKINRELGVTVILSEHRLEEAFPFADRVVVLDGGRILCDGGPAAIGRALRASGHGMFAAMPVPMRVWAGVHTDAAADCPVTVRDGREWLARTAKEREPRILPAAPSSLRRGAPAVLLDGVWFRYGKDLPDVIKGLSFRAYSGEVTAILGGNGTGKTTALSLLSGLRRPQRGQIKLEGTPLEKLPPSDVFGRLLGILPQNPQTLFVAKTVREDLLDMLTETPRAERQETLHRIVVLCRLGPLLDIHPYDLSGGEQQRAALAKVLLLRPQILLLDEPTKGMDAEFKAVFAGILRQLTREGAAVVMVSHDLEFCAEYADHCALFFDGQVVAEHPPRAFFSGNSFYTSAANRMARQILPEAVTANDIIAALWGTPLPPPDLSGRDGTADFSAGKPAIQPAPSAPRLTPLRIGALCAAAAAFALTLVAVARHWAGFSAFLSGGGEAIAAATADAWRYTGILLALAVEITVGAVALSWKRGRAPRSMPVLQPPSRKLPKRTVAAAGITFLAIPLTILAGVYLLGDRKFYFISLLVLLETMLPFALLLEGRKPQARELVVLAVLSAIGVVGRTAFFMLPQFKPVTALTIIAGVAFGGEAGFLVGAMTGFVSNMFFGQGPWTPWQMFAFGVIGFLAGVLFRKGRFPRGKPALCVFGGLAALVIFGGIVNPAQVLIYQARPTLPMVLAAYLQGLPFDLVHALATVFFLAVAARPMLEKLGRIKVKYGLVEEQAGTAETNG
ncbi:MAG: ATP-binding cassette domain-containing protein [Oscillospiraceae bacterium]|jgi:energy-coupling factor transport system ATP-binding protein|nr:ATP-binding cassette domain-containing protein [Oscillospiraceae bacterium]